MPITRRSALAALATLPSVLAQAMAANHEGSPMYGLIGKIRCVPGKREAVAALLARATGAMPGCISYIVARDASDADALWVTEVWESPASHQASLSLPAVQAAIAAGRPMIAGFGERFETEPVGGTGLPSPAG